MDEFIKRDETLSEIATAMCKGCGVDANLCVSDYRNCLRFSLRNDEFFEIVNRIPAADVVEVRKGRWANGAFGYGHYWCTACQKEVWSEEEKTNFCPNCGADMREENK